MSEYIGNRIVPRHDGVWDSTKAYEPLIIVYEEGSGDSYISRKDVPAGTGLNQKEYWALCARFSEQVALLREETDGQVAGMQKLTMDTLNTMTQRTEAAEDLTNSNKAALEQRMENIEARQDANVSASTDSSADYAAEMVDARVDDTGRTFDSAGSNVRALGKARTFQNLAKSWGWRDNAFVNDAGAVTSSQNWSTLHMVPVTGGSILIHGALSYMSGKDTYHNIVCFDKSRNYLGGAFRAPEGNVFYDYAEFPLLEGTCFVSISTSTRNKDGFGLYLHPDLRPAEVLSNYATMWQWINGAVEITYGSGLVTVAFLQTCYVCRRPNGNDYIQTKVNPGDSAEVEFTPKGWWAIYFQDEEKEAVEGQPESFGSVHVESNTAWQRLFTKDKFVLAVFYDGLVVYVAPATNGVTVNGIDYGNPAKVAYQADNYRKYLGQELFLEYGQITLDTVAKTIQVTGRVLASCNTCQYFWLEVDEESTPLLESSELEAGHMVILGYDRSLKKLNLYDTKAFQSLGANGYYIAAWYQRQLLYPHMNPGISFVLDGEEYLAGQLFASEQYNSYVEKRYQSKFDALDTKYGRLAGSTLYLASGSFSIDQTAGTMQVTARALGVPENYHYFWLPAQDEAVAMVDNTPLSPGGTSYPMRILAMDQRDLSLNLYNAATFRALGASGYYIASWYNNRLYNAHISPDVLVTVNGTQYKAGDLFDTVSSSFVEKRYQDYVAQAISDGNDGDTLGDIVTPSHWDCMEGRQFSMFFDCLSRHEGRMNLYRITNSKSLTRNEYCLNYTPTAEDSDFNVNVIRLDENTMEARETKPVAVRVHHPLKTKVVRNICICGDSLVDCNQVATEVYRMLAEDGDCEVNQVGTRGPSNGKHEGRGSWKWKDYLADTDYAGKTNAFWDKGKGRLDFQKYCSSNGFEGIDYFLIALGTNDVSQGSTLYRTEAQVEKFVDYAKQFVDALLDPETGYPDCKIGIGLCGPGSDYSYLVNSSMGIFRKSINTLNLALIKTFDEGAYKPNVTCFAHGLRTDRRLAFPYTDQPVTDRFSETSRTLTNSIHPSVRGYQAWADGYYCQIRAWLEEDAE